MVYALAPGLNTMPLTEKFPAEIDVVFETPNVAVFPNIGTVCGVQFAALLQSLLTGLRFHVALSAQAVRTLGATNSTKIIRDRHPEVLRKCMPEW